MLSASTSLDGMIFAGARQGPLHACTIAIGTHVHDGIASLHMSVCLHLSSTYPDFQSSAHFASHHICITLCTVLAAN